MVLLRNFINIFFVPELRKKLLITLGILIVHRIGCHIPVIGIDIEALQRMITQAKGLGGFLQYMDLLSGGNLVKCTLFALGIMPYITSSIMMQVLSMTIPSLEQLAKEGEYGRKIINQYTRYLTFAISIVQSLGYAVILERNNLVLEPGIAFKLMLVLSLTVGSMFVMWLGEQISLFGIGNGSSMIIFAGIVARLPDDVMRSLYNIQEGLLDPFIALLGLIIFIVITACVIFLERGERKIPVQYTRRVVGQRVYGGQSTYIPFKINTAGIMPVIFSGSFLSIPMFLTQVLASRFEFFKGTAEWFSYNSPLYLVLDFLLIIAFSFFYTALTFNPDELSENIKKSGGFIPGLRPGRKTAEFFNYILTRIGLVGAIYLGLLAISPSIIGSALGFFIFSISGTGLLIVVGVALDTAAQIESYLIEHRYEGFLMSGKLKGRGTR